MGLDNGIIVKHKTCKQLPPFIKYPFGGDYYDYDEVEVCYWRKWWGFRNRVVRYLGMNDNTYSANLGITELRAISSILKDMIYDPESATHGYWEDDIVIKQAKRCRWNLFWLIIYIYLHPGTEVIFYDSY